MTLHVMNVRGMHDYEEVSTSQKQFMQQIPLGINGSILYSIKNNFFTSNPCFPCHMM